METAITVEKAIGNERNDFVDIIKGVAMFLMLWGHCIQYCLPKNKVIWNDIVFKTIYTFHMPLLMLISGYLFFVSSQKNNKNLFSRKTLSLIKPIFGGSIFYFLGTMVTEKIISINRNYTIIIDGKWTGMISVLWFLWSVLAATIVMCTVKIYAKNRVLEVLFLIFGVVFVAIIPNSQMNLFMYPFFVIGYYFAKNREKFRKIEKLKYISFVLFPILVFFFKKKHYIYTTGIFGGKVSLKEQIIIDGYRWFVGIVGCIFAITIVELLLKVKAIKKLGKLISVLGKESLQIYILSVVLLSKYLPKLVALIRKNNNLNNIYKFATKNTAVYDLVVTLAITIIYSVALIYISKLFKKLKLSKIFFGR